MPNVAPIMKIQKCQSYGANVIVHGNDMKEAKYHAMSLAKEKGLTYINGYVKTFWKLVCLPSFLSFRHNHYHNQGVTGEIDM